MSRIAMTFDMYNSDQHDMHVYTVVPRSCCSEESSHGCLENKHHVCLVVMRAFRSVQV